MRDVRFTLDHHQLGLVIKVIDLYQQGPHVGEVGNLLHSILCQLVIRLRRRHIEQRLEYRLMLPVYQAIALRRMVLAGMELFDEPLARTEMQRLIGELDPKMVQYVSVHAPHTHN